METKLKRIADVARANPKEKFTSLIHLINKEMLFECHKEMKTRKSSGVDSVTKEEYNMNLDERLTDLVSRMKRQAYKPQPAKRVYIPKAGTDKKRPLGIPAYEDKLVQSALAKVLNAIYEQDFIECSYGFRPGRGAHDAVKELRSIVDDGRIHYVVDTDIKGFFDNVNHEWLMEFLCHRVADVNLQRLIKRFLKAGIMESGIKYDTHSGTPQGGVCSPILANMYLHYALDLWFEKVVKVYCKGMAKMVRYADDSVFCFQYKEDATSFYKALTKRLAKFDLELAEEKTRFILLNKRRSDNDDEGTFDFLGFTYYLDKDNRMKVKTSKAKYSASLKKCKEWMKSNRTLPTATFMKTLVSKLRGHINYFAVTFNHKFVSRFVYEVRKLLFKWLNRRSQKSSFNWDKYVLFLKKYPLPKVRTKVNLFQ
ncbi:MAG: group II intron reverse transcriptase/maturase [Clostridia bacterium]|nr:group II intron reverse transcriptase/maturase [Clostridia bacterium]